MCQIQFVKPYRMVDGKMTDDVINQEDEQVFKDLMFYGGTSNPHAWGYFNTKIKQRFSGQYRNNALHDVVGENFVVGHNRFATKGDKGKNRNNHPFSSKRFTWVHNGIITNDDTLRKKYNIQTKGIVDSAIVGYLVEEFLTDGVEVIDAIKSAIEEIAGDYSIFIQDRETKRLYYFRSEFRDFTVNLYRKTLKDGSSRYIIVGSTDKDNLTDLYKYSLLGFRVSGYRWLSQMEIDDNIIYEISKKGFLPELRFKAMKYEYISSYNKVDAEESDFHDEDYGEYLKPDDVLELQALLEQHEYDVSVIQTMSCTTDGIVELKITGIDADSIVDLYPELFFEHDPFILSPNRARKLIELMNDDNITEKESHYNSDSGWIE